MPYENNLAMAQLKNQQSQLKQKIKQKRKLEDHNIDVYLLNYRNSHVAKLDFALAQLLMNRKIDNLTVKLNINVYKQMLVKKKK